MTCFLINNQPPSSLPSLPPDVLEDRSGWGTQSHPGQFGHLWREGYMAGPREAAL